MKYTLKYDYNIHEKDVKRSLWMAEIDNGYTTLMMNDILFNMAMDELHSEGIIKSGWTDEEMGCDHEMINVQDGSDDYLTICTKCS